MFRIQKFAVSIVALATFMVAPALWCAPPRYTRIDVQGAVQTVATGINPAGDIVGFYIDADSNEHGFLLQNGVFARLDFTDGVITAAWTAAYGISPQGDIVGQYGLAAPDDETLIHGFLFHAGHYYSIDIEGPNDEGGRNTMPYRITPDGKIVGCYHQSAPNGSTIMDSMRGFVLGPDGVSFDSLASTMHGGANPGGDVTGHYWDPVLMTYKNSYVIHNGVTSWFTFPDSKITRAWDINASGDIVGLYRDASNKAHGFLLHQGVFTSMDFPGSTVKLTWAYGINAVGDIVGYYSDQDGIHGFLYSRREPE